MCMWIVGFKTGRKLGTDSWIGTGRCRNEKRHHHRSSRSAFFLNIRFRGQKGLFKAILGPLSESFIGNINYLSRSDPIFELRNSDKMHYLPVPFFPVPYIAVFGAINAIIDP